MQLLSAEELDTIGEVMNISMGSAATALSTMLDKQVSITTPSIQQEAFSNVDSSMLEPAVLVKIQYVEGIDGTNLTMLRSQDMQIILDLLMGNEEPTPAEDFEFDDMAMSAACEVMNQMMGASATALSEILGMCVNISTPTASLVERKEDVDKSIIDVSGDQQVITISFNLEITDVLSTTFACFLSIDLAQRIVSIVNAGMEADIPAPPPVEEVQETTQTVAQQPTGAVDPMMQQQPMGGVDPMMQQQMMGQPMGGVDPMMQQQMMGQPMGGMDPMMQQQMMGQPMGGMDPMMQQQMMQQQMMQQQMMQQQMMGGMYNPYAQPQMLQPNPTSGLKNAEFPAYSQTPQGVMPLNTNMNLLMGVSLDISVVIGRSTQKIKEIMDFGEGTVVELDKQTGAPAEIVVNGKLLAYGDVIVVGDNFGVRITEIFGTKELLDSLSQGTK